MYENFKEALSHYCYWLKDYKKECFRLKDIFSSQFSIFGSLQTSLDNSVKLQVIWQLVCLLSKKMNFVNVKPTTCLLLLCMAQKIML